MRKARQQGSIVYDKRRDVWYYLHFDDEGVRRTRTLGHLSEIPTKAEAWAAVAKLKKTAPQTLPPDNGCSVSEIEKAYIVERLSTVRPETRRSLLSLLNCHVLPEWGSADIRNLKPRNVELWLRGLPLSPKSRVHIRNAMHALIDYAMWAGVMQCGVNPLSLVRVQGSTKRVRKPRVLTVSEFQKLTAELQEPVRTLAIVCACLGLRVSEGLGLRWSDVNWLEATIRIERACVRQRVDDCKTEGSRKTLSIGPELMQVLQSWRQGTQFPEPDAFLFASFVKLGRLPISYTEIRRELRRGAKAAGIGHLSTHSFRHSFRTWIESLGAPVGVQQRAMRHASVTTTLNLYGDALPEDLRQVHQKVSALALHPVIAESDCNRPK
jgi:integrase